MRPTNRHTSRGFTLLELMVVVSTLGIVTSAAGAYYLESRVSAARIEAQVAEAREASLAAEAIARDLRGAVSVHMDNQVLVVPTGAGELRWSVADGALVRSSGGEPWIVARFVRSLEVEPWREGGRDVGWRVHLGFERELLPGRTVRADREALVRRRVE